MAVSTDKIRENSIGKLNKLSQENSEEVQKKPVEITSKINTMGSVGKSHVESIELLGKENNNLKWYSARDFLEWIKVKTRQPSDDAIAQGKIQVNKYRLYYDVNDTITNATATNPNDSESASYDQEQIFNHLERHGEKVVVSNDGSDTLFVIASHDGTSHFSRERPIYPGENKTYYNVYELRLRSPTAGLPYRITEYPLCCSNTPGSVSSRGNPLRIAINISAAGNNTVIAAPAAGLRIRIVNMFYVCTGAVTVTLYSGANAITGTMSFAANSGMGFNGDSNPLQMNTAEAFIMNLGGNVQVSGFVLYYIE